MLYEDRFGRVALFFSIYEGLIGRLNLNMLKVFGYISLEYLEEGVEPGIWALIVERASMRSWLRSLAMRADYSYYPGQSLKRR